MGALEAPPAAEPEAQPAAGPAGEPTAEFTAGSAVDPTTPLPHRRAGAAGLLEVVDRDGHVRQAWALRDWPVRIGRALDNDIVLTDAHLAAHHFSVEPSADGLVLRAGDTVNGVTVEGQHLAGGGTVALATDTESIHVLAGRTRLRLRLAGAALAPEQPLGTIGVRHVRIVPTLGLGALLLGGTAFNTYLEADPASFVRSAGNNLLAALAVGAVWCGAWALLSKTITRQDHFGWHLRVFIVGALALLALTAVPPLLAFALSWPWVTDFSFIATYAIGAIVLYFHMLALEPARPRLLRAVVATGALVGVAVTLWFNQQRASRLGDELYMSHLFPPALRLAPAVPVERLVGGLGPLRELLDKKAAEPPTAEAPGGGPGGNRGDDDE